jgi:hypothetical protein
MSDWNESDWGACVKCVTSCLGNGKGGTYLARDDKRDGLDGAGGELVRAHDLALGGADHASRDEAHPALRVA